MTNFIYLNNKKENTLHLSNLDKNIVKLSKNKEYLNSKIIDIKKELINKFAIEYDVFVNFNYQKILAYSIINICNQYFLKNKKKPHIIISYYESTFLLTLCNKLVKEKIIEEITIISNNNIIEEFKKNKKPNTIFGFISNTNNCQYFNLIKLSTYCKYYNIILVSNNENIIFNYVNNEPNTLYINNQDIILLNYYSYKSRYYLIYIKKKIFNKFSIFNNQIYNDNISMESLLYLINILNFNTNYNKISNIINNNVNNFFNILKEKYKIININEYLNTDKVYYNNCVTIIILDNLFINNITFSILIPNLKYSSNTIIDYLKKNNIIINTNNYKICKQLPKEIINKIISINISYLVKISEIMKLTKLLDNFIIKNNISLQSPLKFSLQSPLQKNKKKITFSNPEFVILNKPFKNNKKKELKSILKK